MKRKKRMKPFEIWMTLLLVAEFVGVFCFMIYILRDKRGGKKK